jgi:hypothetical protein
MTSEIELCISTGTRVERVLHALPNHNTILECIVVDSEPF